MGSRVFWLSLLPFPTRTYTTAQSPAACILHPRTANAYTVGPSPAPGSVRCLQLLGRTWLAPIPESRDHPLHRPFLDKLISENGPAENPQEIILNSLPCKCLFLWDLSRHRFQPDCLLRPLLLRPLDRALSFCFISIDERKPSSQGAKATPRRTARSDRDPARFAAGSPDLPSPGLPEVPPGRRPPGLGPHGGLSRGTDAPVHGSRPTQGAGPAVGAELPKIAGQVGSDLRAQSRIEIGRAHV